MSYTHLKQLQKDIATYSGDEKWLDMDAIEVASEALDILLVTTIAGVAPEKEEHMKLAHIVGDYYLPGISE